MYNQVIDKLNLSPLPLEGGFFRETYRSKEVFDYSLNEVNTKKNLSTAIYYLITPTSFSALHRIKQDEIFHFYTGDPVEMIQIFPSGEFKKIIIGNNIMNGEVPQVVVPAGVWQGTKLFQQKNESWALMGTTVTPAFDFSDFELGEREDLLNKYPAHTTLIENYTHK